MIKRCYLLCLTLLLLCACSSTGIKHRATELDDEISDYNVAMRWAMLDRIEAHHLGKNGEKKPMDRSTMDEIRVTSCNVQDKILNDDVTEAVVKGEIDYYRTDSGTLKKYTFSQNWWYNEKLKRWFIDSEYPTFK